MGLGVLPKITPLPSLSPNKACSGLILRKMPGDCLGALACLGKKMSLLPLLNPLMLRSLILGVCLTQAFVDLLYPSPTQAVSQAWDGI